MANTALLIMDIQNGTLGMVRAPTDYYARVTTTMAAARQAKVPVIHVTTSFRAGHPEISPDGGFAYVKKMDIFKEGDEAVQVPAELEAHEGDVSVVKKRFSAFAGSDLEMLLRSMKIDRVVLAGISTSGVVLSTLRQASDMDFKATVLQDLCLDPDEEVQGVLMGKVFTKQAAVVRSDAWIAELEGI